MKITQLSVFAENKPGHIVAPCRLLAEGGFNIRALSLADAQKFGILRLIIEDWEKAKKALEEAGFLVKATEVLAIEVPDHPGGLADVLSALQGTSVNVEYMYAFPYGGKHKAALIFRFSDTDAAIQGLQAAGINVLAKTQIYKS